MKTREFLSNLLKQAWAWVKEKGMSMSEAMKLAWANAKLKVAMRKGAVVFKFVKVDGSIRDAIGTLAESVVPQIGTSGRRKNNDVTVYFDLTRQAWRSFRKENLIIG